MIHDSNWIERHKKIRDLISELFVAMLQTKVETGIIWSFLNYSQGSGCLKIMKTLLQLRGRNGDCRKVPSIANEIWHVRIFIEFLIHLSSYHL